MSSIQQHYENDGYYINSERSLPADVVRRAADGMEALRRGEYNRGHEPEWSPWKPGDAEDVLCKIEMPQFADSRILDLVSHPLLGEIAAEATGADMVQVWWVQLLYKPPTVNTGNAGTNVGWHQDRNYWQCWEDGSELFTAWVALSDVTLDAGPMAFVKGSHRWGFMPGSDFGGQDLEGMKKAIQVPSGEQWEEVPAVLPPGGFSLHHDLTWHGSGPNHSSSPRMSFAIHLRTNKSTPVDGKREGLTAHIDDKTVCPVIYQR